MSNRKAYESLVTSEIWNITKSKENVKFYMDLFASMDDAQFDQFVKDVDSEKKRLSVVIPPDNTTLVRKEEVMEVAEKYGHKFTEKLWVQGQADRPDFLTPVEFLILLIPLRRASQLLSKKISVPPHTRVRDTLTGQVTGESKGATISGTEIQLHAGMGTVKSAEEMAKWRGGDLRGEAAMTAMLSKYGRASQAVLQQFASGVQVNTALRTFLTAAMHRVNL